MGSARTTYNNRSNVPTPPHEAPSQDLSHDPHHMSRLLHTGTTNIDDDRGIVVMMSQRHMDGPHRDPHRATPSTSVILGK